MTIEEFNLKLKQALLEIQANDVPLRLASYGSVAEVSLRVFTKGGNADGGAIGQYNNDKPIYLNPKKAFGGSKLGTPRGKNGDTKFKNGKPHVTVYLDSYKDYKSILGKPSDGGFVNLELSGDLKSDFENGAVPTPTQIGPHEYAVQLKRNININKVAGLESRYGKIFALTNQEVENFIEDIKFEFAKLFGSKA
jgi:hypothetical protein